MARWQQVIAASDALDREYDDFMSDWNHRHDMIVSERSQLRGEIQRVYGVNPYEYQSPDALEKDVLTAQVAQMADEMQAMREEINHLIAVIGSIPAAKSDVAVVSRDVVADVVQHADVAAGERVVFEETFDAPLSDEKWNNGETPWGNDYNAGAEGTIQVYDPDMVTVEDGIGVMRVEKLDEPVKRKDGTLAHFRAFMINTYNKFHFKYGRLKWRGKMAASIGAWYAVWFLGAPRPEMTWLKHFFWFTEVDIEGFGSEDPNNPGQWNKSRLRCTVHYRDPDDLDDNGKPKMVHISIPVDDPKYNFGDWNDYEIDWTSEYIRFYINGELVAEVTEPKAIPHDPVYVVANTDVGGASGPPELGTFPVQAEFDYIRVIQDETHIGATVTVPKTT